MKVIKIEYTERSSEGIYCNLTYKTFWTFEKEREVFLKEFRTKDFSSYPVWVDSGKEIENIAFRKSVQREMIRSYEKSNN